MAATALAAVLVAIAYPAEKNLWRLRPMLSLSTVTRNKAAWYPDANIRIASPSGCKVSPAPVAGLGLRVIRFARTNCPPPAAPAAAIYVVGDSHAGAYASLLAHYVLNTGALGLMYFEGGCAVLGQKPVDAQICAAFVAGATKDIASRLQPGDTVFMPGLRIPRIADEYGKVGPSSAEADMFDAAAVQWRASSRVATLPILQNLTRKGAVIVLEAPKPEFAAPTFRCADRFNRNNPICAGGPAIPRAVIEKLRAPVMDEFQTVSRAVPGIYIWDPLPILCPGTMCSAYEGHWPLFFDGDHLSGYANEKLEPLFQAFLQGLYSKRTTIEPKKRH